MKVFEGQVGEFFEGDGLFETFLVDRGRIAFATGHFDRLRASARELGFPAPPSDTAILDWLQQYLADAGLAERTLRLNLRLDHGAFSVLTREVDPAIAKAREHGVAVVTVRLSRDRRGRARHKWVERKNLEDAMRRARAAGAGEALLVAPDGCLLEGATSNVFCAIEGVLRTPPTDARILPGVTRSALFAIAHEIGVRIDESPIDAESLLAADEVFLTSAVRMLVPVIRIDERTVGNARPGPLARRLRPLLWAAAFGAPD